MTAKTPERLTYSALPGTHDWTADISADQRCCWNCAFFKPFAAIDLLGAWHGECRRDRPTPMLNPDYNGPPGVDVIGRFPAIGAFEGCGRFKRRTP